MHARLPLFLFREISYKFSFSDGGGCIVSVM